MDALESPSSEGDAVFVPYRKDTRGRGRPRKSGGLPSPARPKDTDSEKKGECQRCIVLSQRFKKFDECIRKLDSVGGCKKCPILEAQLKSLAEELDVMKEAVGKAPEPVKVLVNEISQKAFQQDEEKVFMYTGFKKYLHLMLIYDHVKTAIGNDPSGLSAFQKLLVVLIKLKMNLKKMRLRKQ